MPIKNRRLYPPWEVGRLPNNQLPIQDTISARCIPFSLKKYFQDCINGIVRLKNQPVKTTPVIRKISIKKTALAVTLSSSSFTFFSWQTSPPLVVLSNRHCSSLLKGGSANLKSITTRRPNPNLYASGGDAFFWLQRKHPDSQALFLELYKLTSHLFLKAPPLYCKRWNALCSFAQTQKSEQ